MKCPPSLFLGFLQVLDARAGFFFVQILMEKQVRFEG